jgi:signal transduction histidine kinase
MFRRRSLITYLGIYFFAISTAVRIVVKLRGDPSIWPVCSLVAAILVLMATEPWLFRRSRLYTHLYLAVQTGLVTVLAILPPPNDYFASFFFSLALQAMDALPVRTGFRWISAFVAITGVFMIDVLGWAVGSPLILIYAAAYVLFGSYAAYIRQAETARQENQRVLDELQDAHEQLYLYTAQAEELAVAQERQRLARNLHNSVSQMVFGMSMLAEATRIHLGRDPARAAPELDRLQELSKSALAEMRSLIFELRPTPMAEHGLIPALRHYLATLEREHGLDVALDIVGELSVLDEQGERLFRIVQEALRDLVDQGEVDRVGVTLHFEDGRLTLQVEHRGRRDVSEDVGASSARLAAVRDEVEALGGKMTVDARPGKATRVTVEILSISGVEDDG